MDGKLIIAIIAITSALVFYTVGVFAERRARILKKWHMLVFWIGLCCDAAGTTFMTLIANSGAAESGIGVHGITGAVAIGLMMFSRRLGYGDAGEEESETNADISQI